MRVNHWQFSGSEDPHRFGQVQRRELFWSTILGSRRREGIDDRAVSHGMFPSLLFLLSPSCVRRVFWSQSEPKLPLAVQCCDQGFRFLNCRRRGVKLMELSNRDADLFADQPASEKRRLLEFVLSNSFWAGGDLTPEFRQPFRYACRYGGGRGTKHGCWGTCQQPSSRRLPRDGPSSKIVLCALNVLKHGFLARL